MTTAKRDYYDILAVTREADADEIKSAYRKAALRWHPDRNPDHKSEAEEKFREATEAYSVLSDPQKRDAYNQYGHAGLSGAGFDPGFSRSIFDEFQDIFGEFFQVEDVFGLGGGRRGRRARPQRGADLRYDMTLSFAEAAAGVATKIKVTRNEVCESCHGSGAKAGTRPTVCQQCGGRGQVIYQQGFFSLSRTCPICEGSGQFIKERCADCAGRGRVERDHPLELRIPAGLESNTRLRVSGEGEAGANGGPAGDLYVMIEVKEHDFFERKGADLYCTIPISIVQASLGAPIMVPTLAAEHELKIPEATQSGAVFRLKGKGLPNPHGGAKGDIFVRVHVETPGKLSRDQKRLLHELGETLRTENRPAQRNSSFFDKVKDIFG